MKKVFLLMGLSGSGKTTIAQELAKLGYDVLQSYTTRPKRIENEWGHLFCTVDEYEEFKKKDDLVAYSNIEGHHYFSTREQLYNTDFYIIDPDGIVDLKNKVKDIEFITIYIKASREQRMDRMRGRGDSVEKILSRITTDGIKFANKQFDYAVKNDDLNKALKVIEYIYDIENE